MPPQQATISRPYHRPQVPTPYDSVDQVHIFLADFLYALDSKHDRDIAEADASRLDTDGRGLYEVPKDEWVAQYGIKGLTIYNHLQRSKYGMDGSIWPALTLVGKFFSFLGLTAGLKQAITNKAFGGNTFFVISTTAAISIYIFYYIFSREFIIEPRLCPERFKRRSTGVAEESTWGL